MLEYIQNTDLLGLHEEVLHFSHMCFRGIIVYLMGIALIRINIRFMGARTQTNFVVYIMMGSILATAITGNAPFFPTLGVMTLLVLINWFLALIIYRAPSLRHFFKRPSQLLIENGKICPKQMRRNSISTQDLITALRIKCGTENIHLVEKAFFEETGIISFILKNTDSHQ